MKTLTVKHPLLFSTSQSEEPVNTLMCDTSSSNLLGRQVEDYSSIRAIEAAVYPKHMQYLQDVYTLEDMQEYCESSRVKVLEGDDWYVILADDEFVDVASKGRMTLATMNHIMAESKAWFNSSIVEADLKADTSYPIFRLLERRNKLDIIDVCPWDWDGIEMYKVYFKFV